MDSSPDTRRSGRRQGVRAMPSAATLPDHPDQARTDALALKRWFPNCISGSWSSWPRRIAGRPADMEWMIYGANGYTGRLMVEEAVRRGLRPMLAGRNAAAIEPLAKKLRTAGTRVRARQSRRGARRPERTSSWCCIAPGRSRRPARRCWKPAWTPARTTSTSPARSTCSPTATRRTRARKSAASWCCRAPASTWCRPIAWPRSSSANCRRRPSLVLAFDAGGGPSPGTAQDRAWKASAGRPRAHRRQAGAACRWPGRRAPSSATARSASP